MDNKNEKLRINLFEYSRNISSQLSTLCDPFLSAMGLTTFLYGRVFYDGRYIMLSNNIEWVKSWLWNIPTIEKSVLQATLQHVPLEEPYYFLWCTALKSELVQAHNKIGIWHGFDISYRLKDSVEGWSFSTSQEREQINHIYLNNLKLFHRFIIYLRGKAESLFEIKNGLQLPIFDPIPDLSCHPPCCKKEEMSVLLSSLPLEGYTLHINNVPTKLSRREIECLLHFSQGKTAKEIGRLLEISPRTVETYIKDVKLKTGHLSKSLLADMLKEDLLKWL